MTRSSIPLTFLKFSVAPAAIGGFIMLLSSCGHQAGGTIEVYETVGYQPNHGPFDSNGNYVEQWADSPPKRKYISRDKKKSSPQKAAPKHQYVAIPKVTPKKASTPAPRKSNAVVAVKPKKKPPITHTVKKGDTLYGLSRKYGTSVSSIQRANRLKGSNIGLGKKLIIPR